MIIIINDKITFKCCLYFLHNPVRTNIYKIEKKMKFSPIVIHVSHKLKTTLMKILDEYFCCYLNGKKK